MLKEIQKLIEQNDSIEQLRTERDRKTRELAEMDKILDTMDKVIRDNMEGGKRTYIIKDKVIIITKDKILITKADGVAFEQ